MPTLIRAIFPLLKTIMHENLIYRTGWINHLFEKCKYIICMLIFEWSQEKRRANLEKHGVSFEEASSVFYDEHAIQFFDELHSEAEDRFFMLGVSNKLRILVVIHSEAECEGIIRIISARKATARERKHYKKAPGYEKGI